jgi:hypothetical protein
MQKLQQLINSLQNFAKKRLQFQDPPKLFLKQDQENAKNILGKTAYYDPNEKSITLFTTGRHPKDVLRSFAHELVHHTQNLRGDLSPEKCGEMGMGYAQTNPHMREMEREAYEKGNLCFRDWEDNYKTQTNTNNVTINLKENKKMVKISKKDLKGLIGKILEARLEKEQATEENEELEEGAFDANHYCVHHGGVSHNGSIAMAEAIQHVAPDANGFISHYDMKLADGTILENVAAEDIQVTNASLAEEHSMKRDDKRHSPYKKKMEENEELEEGDGNAKTDKHDDNPRLKGGQKNLPDALQKGIIGGPDSEEEDKKDESKIQTPEQEQALYESRFNKRNEEVFDKLKKLWTK